MCIGLHLKYPLFFPYFLKKTLIFPQIFEKYSNIKFHEIHPVGAELFQADGQTDRGCTGETDRHDKAYGRFFAIL